MSVDENLVCAFQILKPAEQKISQMSNPRPNTPPRIKSTKYWYDVLSFRLNIYESFLVKKK